MNLYEFLDSNLIQNIIVLLTGTVAILIYFLTKRSEKRDAARIIINEIRLAEKTIQEIKNNKRITELSIILPTDTWQDKKHLFIRDLDQDDINIINDFYYKCAYAENYRKLYYEIKNQSVLSKANYLQEKLVDIMLMSMTENQSDLKELTDLYETKRNQLIEMANKEDWLFDPNRPITNLLEYIHNFQMITPANAGKILKRIAR